MPCQLTFLGAPYTMSSVPLNIARHEASLSPPQANFVPDSDSGSFALSAEGTMRCTDGLEVEVISLGVIIA